MVTHMPTSCFNVPTRPVSAISIPGTARNRDPALSIRTPPQWREPQTRHQWNVFPSIRVNAESLEDTPVPLAGLNDLAVRLAEEIFAKFKCLRDLTGHSVGARIGADANHGAQDQGRNAETGIAGYEGSEPGAADRMLWDILPKGVNEDVNVRQDHLRCFIRATYSRSSISCSAEREVRLNFRHWPPHGLADGWQDPLRFTGLAVLPHHEP